MVSSNSSAESAILSWLVVNQGLWVRRSSEHSEINTKPTKRLTRRTVVKSFIDTPIFEVVIQQHMVENRSCDDLELLKPLNSLCHINTSKVLGGILIFHKCNLADRLMQGSPFNLCK
jgi:hypothetical protein